MEKIPCLLLDCFIVILFLFPCLMMPSVFGSELRDQSSCVFLREVLYVGGDGPGNYTHIQDAIDDATDGDTIFVFNGMYYEHLVVDKTVTLLGENAVHTFIDGSGIGSVVRISAAVRVSGFTIQHGERGIENYELPVGCIFTIEGNVIRNNVFGIVIAGSQDHVVMGNTFKFNEIGVNLFSTRSCVFHENNFQNNGRDAYFEFLHFPPVLFWNSWRQNFWDEWELSLPKPVWGRLVIVFVFRPGTAEKKPLCPWFNFDWRPAKEPFDLCTDQVLLDI